MNRIVLTVVYSSVLLILVALSVACSIGDMAFGSVNTQRLKKEADSTHSKSKIRAYKLSQNYDRTISTLVFLNDITNVGIDTLATLLGINIAFLIFGESYPQIEAAQDTWSLILSFTFLVIKITFGEIIAKSIGRLKNYFIVELYSMPLGILSYALLPFTIVGTGLGKAIIYPFQKHFSDIGISEDELHEMVDEIEEEGQIDEDKAEILHGAIDYAETEAYEIMTPRVDVYAIDINDDIEEIMHDERTYEHTRIPVYEDSIDNIIGFVQLSVLIKEFLENKEETNIKAILREPLFLPRSTEINDILKKFKRTRQHFAVVLDEYGGVEGVLTMEDILEEIVGEIWDETDDKETIYQKRKDGKYIVDGMMRLEDFCDLFEINYDELQTEYNTIAGYCIELLDNNFAKRNQIIKFGNLDMKVLAIDEKHTIEKLLITVNKNKEE